MNFNLKKYLMLSMAGLVICNMQSNAMDMNPLFGLNNLNYGDDRKTVSIYDANNLNLANAKYINNTVKSNLQKNCMQFVEGMYRNVLSVMEANSNALSGMFPNGSSLTAKQKLNMLLNSVGIKLFGRNTLFNTRFQANSNYINKSLLKVSMNFVQLIGVLADIQQYLNATNDDATFNAQLNMNVRGIVQVPVWQAVVANFRRNIDIQPIVNAFLNSWHQYEDYGFGLVATKLFNNVLGFFSSSPSDIAKSLSKRLYDNENSIKVSLLNQLVMTNSVQKEDNSTIKNLSLLDQSKLFETQQYLSECGLNANISDSELVVFSTLFDIEEAKKLITPEHASVISGFKNLSEFCIWYNTLKKGGQYDEAAFNNMPFGDSGMNQNYLKNLQNNQKNNQQALLEKQKKEQEEKEAEEQRKVDEELRKKEEQERIEKEKLNQGIVVPGISEKIGNLKVKSVKIEKNKPVGAFEFKPNDDLGNVIKAINENGNRVVVANFEKFNNKQSRYDSKFVQAIRNAHINPRDEVFYTMSDMQKNLDNKFLVFEIGD